MNSIRTCYGIADQKIHMIHNGVDTDFWDPKKVTPKEETQLKNQNKRNDKYMILYYGHAGKSKGLDYLIQAISETIKSIPNAHFVFNLIHSRRTANAKKQILKYGKHVQVIDGLEKQALRTLVSCADLVVAPSISEGFGSVHTEAVAMGKPLLTTYIASIPEVVRGKVKFIAPGSTKEIVHGVQDMYNGKYTEIPQKKFSRDDTVKKIEKLYK